MYSLYLNIAAISLSILSTQFALGQSASMNVHVTKHQTEDWDSASSGAVSAEVSPNVATTNEIIDAVNGGTYRFMGTFNLEVTHEQEDWSNWQEYPSGNVSFSITGLDTGKTYSYILMFTEVYSIEDGNDVVDIIAYAGSAYDYYLLHYGDESPDLYTSGSFAGLITGQSGFSFGIYGAVATGEVYGVESLSMTGVVMLAEHDPNVTLTPTGDFNGDSTIDANDIDILAGAIAAYSAYPSSGFPYARYDLDSDSSVNSDDMDYLIRSILNTEYGDADLDGDVDNDDLDIVIANYNLSGGWAKGDFDGNFVVNANDDTILDTYYGFPTTP